VGNGEAIAGADFTTQTSGNFDLAAASTSCPGLVPPLSGARSASGQLAAFEMSESSHRTKVYR
jgi:hypothetical protein